ncbi:hypothetical protein CSHISOI_04903 [Colletotrichum shisoi]|uniref:Uncharacterized protein n=1 Tax=Colletotrichum shisoi TaxID=2078593 RepID=A0A5Q4BUU9_9PEZI|nr:hypothetical protein CSHISOI_04903 [Colletotrichum shisoi]
MPHPFKAFISSFFTCPTRVPLRKFLQYAPRSVGDKGPGIKMIPVPIGGGYPIRYPIPVQPPWLCNHPC